MLELGFVHDHVRDVKRIVQVAALIKFRKLELCVGCRCSNAFYRGSVFWFVSVVLFNGVLEGIVFFFKVRIGFSSGRIPPRFFPSFWCD